MHARSSQLLHVLFCSAVGSGALGCTTASQEPSGDEKSAGEEGDAASAGERSASVQVRVEPGDEHLGGERGEDGSHGRHGEHGEHAGAGALDGGHRHHGGHHRFEDPEAWAAEFDSPKRLAWQKPEAVIAKLGLAKSAVVADLGAGTGTFAVRFAAAVPDGKVFANDIEASMVAYLEKRAKEAGLDNLVAIRGDADDPKLPELVDLAFMCDVYHHVEDLPGFFGEVRGRLREGGRLVIVDFKKDAPDDAPGPPKAMRVRSSDVVRQLTALGYRVIEVDSTTLEYQYIVIFDRA